LGKTKNSKTTLSELVEDQRRDGSFRDVTQTITCSRGESLIVETTSFALLAMIRIDFNKWEHNIDKGINFLMRTMKRGFFSSSQASVLAFKVLMEYLEKTEPPKDFPLFQIKVNGVAHHIQTGDPLKKHKNSKDNFL
jgi:hypothetical protein